MNDSLFNAELRDCARINEIQEQRAPVAQEREISRDEQAYYNACDQGHDWDDYDDPVNLYGEDGYFGFNGWPIAPLTHDRRVSSSTSEVAADSVREQVRRGACFAFAVSGEASSSKGSESRKKYTFF